MFSHRISLIKHFLIIFFFTKRKKIYLLVEWCNARTNQITTLGYVSHTKQISALGYVSYTNQISALGYVSYTNHVTAFGYYAPITAFTYCFLVNDVMESRSCAQRMT